MIKRGESFLVFFKPIEQLTKYAQTKGLLYSDFLLKWFTVRKEIQSSGENHLLKDYFIENFEFRILQKMDNDLVKVVLFSDTRTKKYMTDADVLKIIRKEIIKIYKKINGIKRESERERNIQD